MHQTTLRFSPHLWEMLEREAASAGVSVAQYVREAALSRIAYDAGRRGDPELAAAIPTSVEPGQAPKAGRDGAL